MENEQNRDKRLWHLAKKRAAFKISFTTYLIVNAFLVGVWYFTSGPGTYFWPIWPILGWGVGVVIQYANAYHTGRLFSAEDEYERLKQQKKF